MRGKRNEKRERGDQVVRRKRGKRDRGSWGTRSGRTRSDENWKSAERR